MPPIAIITAALSAAQQAATLYLQLKELWSHTLTPEQKQQLAAQEEALFAEPQWQSPGATLRQTQLP